MVNEFTFVKVFGSVCQGSLNAFDLVLKEHLGHVNLTTLRQLTSVPNQVKFNINDNTVRVNRLWVIRSVFSITRIITGPF